MRDHVAKEILQSEQTFVEQLSTLASVYIRPLRRWSEELKASYGRGSMHPVLPDNFLVDIFANLEQLLVFNQHIVKQLEEVYGSTKAFGAFFRKAAPFFKMYSSYVSNYDRAMDTLTELMETRLDFASFVRACEYQEGCKGLNLRSYLIMPVQRVPRYKLLLTELLKHTPATHPDYTDLIAAVNVVSEVVNSINEDIKRQERRFKVVEVQDMFETDLVTASRVFLREGDLVKMCRKGPKRFYFVLFNDLLVYGAEKIGSQGRYALHRKMDLCEMFVIDSGETERSFIVATKIKSFVVQCKDVGEKRDWVETFKSAFSDLDKSVIYRSYKRDAKWTSITMWMVRERDMVRELYALPNEFVNERCRGVMTFNQLRQILDPQLVAQAEPGIGTRVRSFFGGKANRVGAETPVPCDDVSQIPDGGEDDDDKSTYSDLTSPTTMASDMSPLSPSHQADLLGAPELSPPRPLQASLDAARQQLSYETPRPISGRRPSQLTQEASPRSQAPPPATSPTVDTSQRQPQALEQRWRSQQRDTHTYGEQSADGRESTPRRVTPPQQMSQDVMALQRRQSSSNVPLQPSQPVMDAMILQRRQSSSNVPIQPSQPVMADTMVVHRRQSSSTANMPTLQPPPQTSSSPQSSARGKAQPDLMSLQEYVAVIPVTESGLGLFLKDESGEVVIGGFRAPRNGMGANPSQKAGVRLGDVLVRVNGIHVSSVAQTISALRESRMEQVIALTVRRMGDPTDTLRKTSRGLGSQQKGTFRGTSTKALY